MNSRELNLNRLGYFRELDEVQRLLGLQARLSAHLAPDSVDLYCNDLTVLK